MRASSETTLDDYDALATRPDGGFSPASTPQPRSFTRGMNARAFMAWVKHTHGADGVTRLAAALPPEVVTLLGGPALRPAQMAWIPFMAHATLLEQIDRTFGAGDLKLLLEVGAFAAQVDFPRIARPVARLLSPGLFLDMATRVWRFYHSHGEWEMTRGSREIVAMLLGRPEQHAAFCFAMRGWVEGAMAVAGAASASTEEIRCAALGAPCCTFRMVWRENGDDARGRLPRPPT